MSHQSRCEALQKKSIFEFFHNKWSYHAFIEFDDKKSKSLNLMTKKLNSVQQRTKQAIRITLVEGCCADLIVFVYFLTFLAFGQIGKAGIGRDVTKVDPLGIPIRFKTHSVL